MRRAALGTDYCSYLLRSASVAGAMFGVPFAIIALFYVAFDHDPKRWSLGTGLAASVVVTSVGATIRVIAEAAGRTIMVNAHRAIAQYPWPPESRDVHAYEQFRIDRIDGLARVEFRQGDKAVLVVGATMEQAEGLKRHLSGQRKPEVLA